MKTNLYGDIAIEIMEKDKKNLITRGDLNLIHDIFNEAVKRGMKPRSNTLPSFMYDHFRVMNALDRDERFEKSYICYNGIVNRPCRCFRLKKE